MPYTPISKRLPSLQQTSFTASPPMPFQHSANTAQCTTVTMMLANRIAHNNDWSVDDEHFFETNTMNVWQTLEFLSSLNLRKRYHYEGYSDTENAIRALTPSWRRDSYAEKVAAAANKEENNVAGGNSNGRGNGNGNGSRCGKAPTSSDDAGFIGSNAANMRRDPFSNSHKTKSNGATSVSAKRKKSKKSERRKCNSASQMPTTGRSKYGNQQKRHTKSVPIDPQYVLSETEYTDLVKCNFNLPRISAALERLIGTNVVRLTDHKFMSELRKRLEEENRNQLERRIMARALREVERERLLIIEGKTDEIPEELADDPIFVVNKIANREIQKERAKLKTNRERNAEHLKAQGSKWERERQKYVVEEQQRVEKIKERKKAQFELEERYKAEDAERGMDLLRIDNEEWRECEKELKHFLEEERAKMKERSLRIPRPFTTDKQDILNIVRARKKFREAEQRICKQLEEGTNPKPAAKETKLGKELAKKTSVIQKHVQDIIQAETEGITEADDKEIVNEMSEREKDEKQRRKYLDDASDGSTETEVYEQGSTISESKRRHAADLEEEMEYDVERGYLISKMQFEQLRYHDDKILLLQQASDMRELYQLAEDIIIGERVEEEVVEEEMVEEEEQPIVEEEEEQEDFDNF